VRPGVAGRRRPRTADGRAVYRSAPAGPASSGARCADGSRDSEQRFPVSLQIEKARQEAASAIAVCTSCPSSPAPPAPAPVMSSTRPARPRPTHRSRGGASRPKSRQGWLPPESRTPCCGPTPTCKTCWRWHRRSPRRAASAPAPASAGCAGRLEMTHPPGMFHRCTDLCPRVTLAGRQFGGGALPVPYLPPRVPGVLQDRGDRARVPACAAEAWVRQAVLRPTPLAAPRTGGHSPGDAGSADSWPQPLARLQGSVPR
jgi:hypothetical protein